MVIDKVLRAVAHHIVIHFFKLELLLQVALVGHLVRILLTDDDEILIVDIEQKVTQLVLANAHLLGVHATSSVAHLHDVGDMVVLTGLLRHRDLVGLNLVAVSLVLL